MRARAPVRHLLCGADRAYGAEDVRRGVGSRLAARPGFAPAHDGPDRAAWEALVTAAD
ncbi:hypothetical protein [Streptantibioticus silvisoli]|uniref:Uncharacterized protein n=1 Tax=Streptantibioticus silvisoli TaxID=2705255 RepID=A0ABT6VVK8_9ACTN|nr:hypothetical protein [Streptantibioticus silvisoli]MDI5962520.1 hypothetical protein [Streptantibioticus silvisoli]